MLDEAVLEVTNNHPSTLRSCLAILLLPKGTRVVSAESWGISAWTKTAKIDAVLGDGTAKRSFFESRSREQKL